MRLVSLPLLALALVLLVGPVRADDEKSDLPPWPVPPEPKKCACGEEPAEEPLVPPQVPEEIEGDPRSGEVPVPAADGWNASLMFDNDGVGVWTVRIADFFPDFAAPDVHAVDDLGRLHVLTGYSGRWSATTTLSDRIWLGGLLCRDVDPRVPGPEVYTGGGMGNLYCVTTSRHGVLSSKLISFLPGHEIHTIVAARGWDRSDPDLIVFTNPPAVYRVSPTGDDGTWETRLLDDPGGLVRNAVVLPDDEDPEFPVDRVVCVSRAGWVKVLRVFEDEVDGETVHRAETGVGRVAASPDGKVLYSTLDDGRVLRHEKRDGGAWKTETIFLGPQGPRGLVAGKFFEDGREAVAIFGYSKRVQLLSRTEDGWTAETILRSRDKGHWLAVGELDGRNSTDEIVATGYDGRVYLLARPPGYGRPELTD